MLCEKFATYNTYLKRWRVKISSKYLHVRQVRRWVIKPFIACVNCVLDRSQARCVGPILNVSSSAVTKLNANFSHAPQVWRTRAATRQRESSQQPEFKNRKCVYTARAILNIHWPGPTVFPLFFCRHRRRFALLCKHNTQTHPVRMAVAMRWKPKQTNGRGGGGGGPSSETKSVVRLQRSLQVE